MTHTCIYQPMTFPGTGGGGGGDDVPSFSTWNALEIHLASQSSGSLATVSGQGTLPVVVAMANGVGGLAVISDVNFGEGGGSEFTIGPGLNIETLTGGPPVQPTLSSNGLDVSLIEGVCRFNFLKYTGNMRCIQALFDCSIPNESVGQVLAIGQGVGAGAGDVYGAVHRGSGPPTWHRASYRGTPPVSLGTDATNNSVLTPAGDQFVFLSTQTTTDTLDRVAFTGGGFDSTDPFDSVLQSSFGQLTLVDLSVEQFIQVFCLGLGEVNFSAIVKKVRASGGLG